MPTDRRDLRRRLFNLAAEQAGYFTAAQAKDVGYSYQAQAHHVQAGNWLRIDRGLFRLAEWIPDVHDDLVAVVAVVRIARVVSHETALARPRHRRVRVGTCPPDRAARLSRCSDDAVVLHQPSSGRRRRGSHRLPSHDPRRSLIDVAARHLTRISLPERSRSARSAGRSRSDACGAEPKRSIRRQRSTSSVRIHRSESPHDLRLTAGAAHWRSSTDSRNESPSRGLRSTGFADASSSSASSRASSAPSPGAGSSRVAWRSRSDSATTLG